jgi:ubiquinone biosynthesis protein UbiJ
MAGFERLIVPALNHLIQKENWAKERLQPFSGAQLQISAGSIHIQLSINEARHVRARWRREDCVCGFDFTK